MPKVINQNNQTYYQCEECGFKYEEKEWAEKCETWCKERQSCNLEIIEHALKQTSPEKRGE